MILLTPFNLTNGVSRLVSGYGSDILGRSRMMGASFLCAACAYWLLAYVDDLLWWAVLAAVVGFAFGTLFAVSAPLVVDCFGMGHFGAVFGLVFTAYGFVAGVLGPWLSGYVLDASGGRFESVFLYLGGFYLISAILISFQSRSRPNPRAGPGQRAERGRYEARSEDSTFSRTWCSSPGSPTRTWHGWALPEGRTRFSSGKKAGPRGP